MGTFKAVSVLCVILLIILMGSFEFKSTKSKPHHARRKTAFTDKEGDGEIHKLKLKSTDREYLQLEDYENQGEMCWPRTLEEIDFYTGIKIRQGTGHAIPMRSKVGEGSGYQREMGKPGIQDHTENYTMDIGKTGSDSISYTSSKVAENYEDEIKMPEIDDPDTGARDENEKGSYSISYTPSKVAESDEDELKTPEKDHRGTEAGDENEKATTMTADHADEMKYSQNNRNENYNQLWETPESRSVNVDQEGTGGTAGKIATKRGTEIKRQHPSGNESDGNKLHNIKRDDDTADKAEGRPAGDTHGAGNENERTIREKTSTDPTSTVQDGRLGTSVDGRIREGSSWAMAEAPAASNVYVKEGEQNRNRRIESTSDNFGHGDGRKSNNVHRSSTGKPVSRGDIIDKGRTNISLAEKNDAFAVKKPAIENETMKNCENIGIPLEIVFLLIMGVSIACLGTVCCFKNIYYWHSYERAAGEISTPSRKEVRQQDVTSKRRPQTDESKVTSTYAAFRPRDGFGVISCKIVSDNGTEAVEQTASVKESDKDALQNIEREEGIVDKAETTPAGDKYSAGNECDSEVTEMVVNDRVTGVRDDKPATWQDVGTVGERSENLATENESNDAKLQRIATDVYTLDSKKRERAEDEHLADREGFAGITERIESDHDPETKEQLAGVNQSDKGALQSIELGEDIIDKDKTRHTKDKHSALNERHADVSEKTDEIRVTGLRDETPTSVVHGGRIVYVKESIDTGNESDDNIPERITTEGEAVDNVEIGLADNDHHVDNGERSGITCRIEADQEPQSEKHLSSTKVSDRTALPSMEREEDIVDKAKYTPAEYKHENKAEATEEIGKDRLTGVRDDKPGTWKDERRIGGFVRIIDKKASDHHSETEELPVPINESDKGALQNIELVEDIVDKVKTRRTKDKHGASNESDAEVSEMTDKDRVTDLRVETTKSSEEGGRIFSVTENLDSGNELDGNIPERIATEGEAVDNAKRGPANDNQHGDNGGNSGITCRKDADQELNSEERLVSIKVSDRSALQNRENEEYTVNEAKKALVEYKHETNTETTILTGKDPVTGVPADKPDTLEDEGRISGFGGIACKMAPAHDPEAEEQTASVNEFDKNALQNRETEKNVVDKAKTASTGDKHGDCNECEVDSTEMTGKDLVAGVQDDRPGTSEDVERIGGCKLRGQFSESLKRNSQLSKQYSLSHSRSDTERSENPDTEDDGKLQRIATEVDAVNSKKRGRAEYEHNVDNEGFGGITDREDYDSEAKEQPASVNESEKEMKENLDTGNESDGNIPERIAADGEAVDNEKRRLANDEHHADNREHSGITCRMDAEQEPKSEVQFASMKVSNRSALHNIEREEDIVNEAKKARVDYKHEKNTEATELTSKDRVSGVRGDKPGSSKDEGRISGYSVITRRMDADHDPDSEEQLVSIKVSDRSALPNIEREEDVVNKAKKTLAEDKHESKAEAAEMTRKVRVTCVRDNKPGASQDEGWIGRRNEDFDSENESDGDKLKRLAREVDTVDGKKRRREEYERDAVNEAKFGGIADGIVPDHDPKTKEQPSGGHESDKGALQRMELVEGVVPKVKRSRTEDNHSASSESAANDSETTDKDRVTGLQAETPTSSENGGQIVNVTGNLDTGNESDSNIPERAATEGGTADNAKVGSADDGHYVAIGGFGGITNRIASDQDPKTKEPATVNESDKGVLQNIDLVEDIIGKVKTRCSDCKHGASNEGDAEALEMNDEDWVTGLRDEAPTTSEYLERIVKIKENLDTGNESVGDIPEGEAVDNEKRGPLDDDHRAVNRGNNGFSFSMDADQEPETKEQIASMNMPDRSALQNTEGKEHTVDITKKTPAEDKHESKTESKTMTGNDRITGVRDYKSGTSQDEGRTGDVILQHRNNLRTQSMKLNLPNPRLLSDIYTDLRITVTQYELDGVTGENKRQVREAEIHEILKRSNNDTDATSVHVVYGAAGTGKNTLIQKIIYDWATGMKYEEFSFLFHFKIQNLNSIKGRVTLRALILEAYPYLENYLDHLWKEPKSLLFVFDDLDRLYRSFIFSDNERHLDPQYKCSGTESVCFVYDILRCLLDGNFLRGCLVLITTRHWNQEILRHVAIDAKFHAMGFTSEEVKEYFCRHLRHGQCTNGIIQLIEQSDILRNMCSNPLFCVTLASSPAFYQPEREQTTMLVIKHTHVLLDYVTLLLQECGYDRNTTHKCLREVGQLAYNGIKSNKLSFEAGALWELKTCPDNFTTVFMFQDPDKQSTGVVYEFKHYVIRDFLAALTHILYAPRYRLKRVLDEMFMDTSGRFRTFLLFLIGLSSRKSAKRLKFELDSAPSDVTLCISEWITTNVKRRLMNMEQKCTQSMFLHILDCLHEFENNQILKELLASFTTIKLNQLTLKPLDCTVLSETLINSEAIEELDLSSCLTEPEEIQILKPALHKCVILRLNHNNLQDSGVKHLANILKRSDCKIQILELNSNRLTDDCLDILLSALSTNSSLKELNLTDSAQGEKHANQFTHEKFQYAVDISSQQKQIRWL